MPKLSFASKIFKIEITGTEGFSDKITITKCDLHKYNMSGDLVMKNQTLNIKFPYVKHSILSIFIGNEFDWPSKVFYNLEGFSIDLEDGPFTPDAKTINPVDKNQNATGSSQF